MKKTAFARTSSIIVYVVCYDSSVQMYALRCAKWGCLMKVQIY